MAKVDMYEGRKPAEIPAYTAGDVASLLSLPTSTVTSWTFGTTYGKPGAKKRFAPIIKPADRDERLLSFTNLVEVHVLSALRRQHKVSLESVRRATHFLRKELGSEHPLATTEMRTAGRKLFVNTYGKYVNISEHGAQLLLKTFEVHLSRVKRQPDGPIRLFPFTRVDYESSPKHVAIDPRYRFGRPFLTKSGVELDAVTDRYQAGESIEQLAKEFGCQVAEIEEAIRYSLVQAA